MKNNAEPTQFRVLYRLFVFRLVDVELLSANALGDANKLLGQIAALLVFISIFFSFLAAAMTPDRNAPTARLLATWNAEHVFLATAMLIATVLAVLSWDSFFQDRRDVMTLSVLPVRSSTMFMAKAAALASVTGALAAAFSAFPVFCYSVALAPAAKYGILDIHAWAGGIRAFLAFGATVALACVFPLTVIAIVQSAGALVLRRRLFLRLSSVLQLAAFAAAVGVFSLGRPVSASLQGGWLPSQWLLGSFFWMNGSLPPELAPLAQRGAICFALLIPIAAACYAAACRTVGRQIVEQPDLIPSARSPLLSLRLGSLVETAIVLFSARTLARSKQHRVVLALYLGLALAIVVAAIGAPRVADLSGARSPALVLPGLIATIVSTILAIVGLRMVFVLPQELRANWIFQTLPVPSAAAANRAARKALIGLAAMPVWLVSGALTLTLLPPRAAAAHAAVLALLALIVVELCLWRFDKLPFACSYLPGKSNFNMAFLGFAALLETVVVEFAIREKKMLAHPQAVAKLLLCLGAAWALLYWRSIARARSREGEILFEQREEPAVNGLGLFRDGVLPTLPQR